MNPRKLIIFLILMVSLTALSFVKANYLQKEKKSLDQEAKQFYTLNQDFDSSAASKITIQRAGSSEELIDLEKDSNSNWVIRNRFNAPAQSSAVQNFLKKLTAIKGEVRSDNKEVLGDYQLLENQALSVEIKNTAGKSILHLLISPKRPQGNQNFVRDAASDKALITEADLLGMLNIYAKDSKLSPKIFLNLKTADFQAAQVSKIEFKQTSGEAWTLTKNQDAKTNAVSWVMEPAPAKGSVQNAKVDELLNTLTSYYGRDILDPAGQGYGFDNAAPWIRLTLKKADKEETIEYYLGKQESAAKTYTLKIMPAGRVYLVSESGVEPLIKKDKQSFIS